MKLAYNITYVVDAGYVNQWRHWMISDHLPAIMKSGCFLSYRLHKLIGLSHSDEPTYSVQFLAKDKNRLREFQEEYEDNHNRRLHEHFRNKVVEFRTTMVVLDEG